jgi:DNA polymerase delta subunit 1
MMKYSDCDTVEKAFVKLKEVCVAVTKTFPSPVELQPEKVYSPHLQLGKKRYVGLCHIMGEKPKIDSKGVESNRLDNCPLVRRMMKEVFEYLFVRNDLQGALKFVRDTAIDLIQGRIEMAELVVTKSVSKDNYAGKMTHIEVAKRMKARDPSYMFAPGERIPYVITLPENKGPINHGGSKSGRPYDTKLHEQAEDPLWCITHDMQIDTMYYLENQLSGPLARIFMWYIGDKNHIAMIHTMEDRLHEPGRSALECAQINHDIDKEIKKMTLAVATKLLGPLAFLNVPRSKPRLSGPISRFITKVSKKLTPEEEEAKLAKAVELHEKLTQFRAVCIKCRGHEDFTIQCQQRDCPNLFRLAQTNRDIEDLAN